MDKITKKVAMFEEVSAGFTVVFEFPTWSDEDDYTMDGYVRVSEWTDIEFTPINHQSVVDQKIAIIDAEIQDARAKFQVTLNGLEQRKAELLAIPDMRE